MRQKSADKILTEFGWERLECSIYVNSIDGIMFFEMTNNLAPPYLTSICPPKIASTSDQILSKHLGTQVQNITFQKIFFAINWNGLAIDVMFK